MDTLKQPFEDVTHKVSKDDALLTDVNVSLMVGKLANALRKAYLNQLHQYAVGSKAKLMWERMNTPKVGDLVFVSDMFYRRNQSDTEMMQAVGYLIEKRDEWGSTDAEWEKAKAEDNDLATDADRYIEREVYYIQYGPNHVCRWVNSSIYAVVFEETPSEPAEDHIIQRDVFSDGVGQTERTIHGDSTVTYRNRKRLWDGKGVHWTEWKEGRGEY